MNLGQTKWAAAVLAGAVSALAAGCAAQSDSTVATHTNPATNDQQAAEQWNAGEQPPDSAARFAGAVSLYGEIVRADTSLMPINASDNLRQMTATRQGADFDVTIDPDGDWLCFASTRHNTTANLYLRRVNGAAVTQLTSDPGNDVMPAFSPDGRYVAFSSDRSGTWNIYLKPVEGGKAVQLTDDPSQELHPSFSPDGRQIVFSARSNRSGQWEMVVVDIENPAKRRFIGYGLFPTFSPDGDKIAFQRARQRGSRTFSLWTLDYHDGQASRPTEIAAAANAAIITPAWSPDGERLAFATVIDPGAADAAARPEAAELWIVGIDGTSRVRMTQDSYANLQPAWSSDGVIYFSSNRSGHENIWALRPAPTSILAERDFGFDEPQASVQLPLIDGVND